jgi:hypothetical protein
VARAARAAAGERVPAAEPADDRQPLLRLLRDAADGGRPALARGRRPEQERPVARFLDALGETVAASGRRVAFVAGADLAHVGPRFGDARPVSRQHAARLAAADRATLATVSAGDADGFFDDVARDGDARRICGLSPIWALLRATGGAPGELRHYGQTPDPQCLVSFGSVVF